MPAKNLTYKQHLIVGINKLCPYETKIAVEHSRKTVNKNPEITYKKNIDDSKVTHEAHLTGTGLKKCSENLHDPSQDVIIIIWFSAASAIERPSSSKCVIYNDEVYYIITWTDVLGKEHQKMSELKRQRDGKMIYYLRREENQKYKELIFNLIKERQLL